MMTFHQGSLILDLRLSQGTSIALSAPRTTATISNPTPQKKDLLGEKHH
jgi:hypothetical protein